MHKILQWTTSGLLALGLGHSVANAEDFPVIAVSQIVEHPALAAIYDGMIEELAAQGYKDGATITIYYQIAQGDMALNSQIAKQFVGEKPDLIVASTTPSAQAVLSAAHGEIPVIFTGVTDPIAAKLVDNLEKPGKNVTGVKETLAYQANIDNIAALLPKATRIGTIYNPGEDNSNATNAILQEMIDAKGWTFVTAPAKNTGDVLDAARSLVGKVDVILISTDNTAVSAFPSIAQVADQNDIPLLTFDTFSVPKGAAMGIGYDEYDVGRLTAKKVIEVLNGANPGDIPVSSVEKLRIVINPSAAERQGLVIPQSIIETASEIIETP